MADLRKHSSTSNIVRLVLKKKSDGTAFTGLAYNSANLRISVIANNEAAGTTYVSGVGIQDITTLGTFEAPSASNVRFKEVSAANHPGLYEIHILDARFSVANAKTLVVTVTGVTDLLTADYEIALTGFDPFDAVALGLSRLDAAITSRMATFTLPDNFSALLINANGHISRVSLVDLLTVIDTDGIPAAALTAAAVAKIEAALLNEGDGQALIDAIVQAIDAADIDTDILPALIRDAILNRVLAGNHDTAGSVGKVLQDIIADTGTDIPALIAALNNLSAAQVRTEADAALAAYDGPTNTEMNARTLPSASYATSANQTTMDGKLDTLLTRITATLFAGITSLANWLGAMAGKHAPDATAETEINATGAGGGDFSAVTDSLQANRDSGGGGGGGTNVHVEQQSVVIKGSAS